MSRYPCCPSCEAPVDDENRPVEMPPTIVTCIRNFDIANPTDAQRAKRTTVIPAQYAGVRGSIDDGCRACISDVVNEFAKLWLAEGPANLQDVGDLIAEYMTLAYGKPVTA
jgi:hypothetical protein